MPASSALSTGSPNALVSTTATARPSTLADTEAFSAFTISVALDVFEPVHRYSQPSSAQASAAPYWVGTKNGFVVTWLTKVNFHFGVSGKSPALPLAAAPDLFVQPASSAEAASVVLNSPAPPSRRRRVTAGRSRVSTASATVGSIRGIGAPGG